MEATIEGLGLRVLQGLLGVLWVKSMECKKFKLSGQGYEWGPYQTSI